MVKPQGKSWKIRNFEQSIRCDHPHSKNPGQSLPLDHREVLIPKSLRPRRVSPDARQKNPAETRASVAFTQWHHDG